MRRAAAGAKPVKMLGPAVWCAFTDDYYGKVERAILRGGDELVIELECDGRFYGVELYRRGGDRFEGNWSRRDGATVTTGAASAKLYRSADGDLLFGEWAEDGIRYHWWAELRAVKHFADEEKRSHARSNQSR